MSIKVKTKDKLFEKRLADAISSYEKMQQLIQPFTVRRTPAKPSKQQVWVLDGQTLMQDDKC